MVSSSIAPTPAGHPKKWPFFATQARRWESSSSRRNDARRSRARWQRESSCFDRHNINCSEIVSAIPNCALTSLRIADYNAPICAGVCVFSFLLFFTNLPSAVFARERYIRGDSDGSLQTVKLGQSLLSSGADTCCAETGSFRATTLETERIRDTLLLWLHL